MPQPPSNKIPILYEDAYYIVFDKPSGLLVIPTPKKEKNTLVSVVNQQYVNTDDARHLYPCHRLDRDTSGAIIFAKGKKNQQLLMEQFRMNRVRKQYIAIVQGRPKTRSGEIKSLIRDFDQIKYNRFARAKLAITRYKIKEVRKNFSILFAYPLTGRTNQIRIHFSQNGFPILGDRKYAIGKEFAVKFKRTALHASKVQWYHPIYKKIIDINSSLPDDMTGLIMKH